MTCGFYKCEFKPKTYQFSVKGSFQKGRVMMKRDPWKCLPESASTMNVLGDKTVDPG